MAEVNVNCPTGAEVLKQLTEYLDNNGSEKTPKPDILITIDGVPLKEIHVVDDESAFFHVSKPFSNVIECLFIEFDKFFNYEVCCYSSVATINPKHKPENDHG